MWFEIFHDGDPNHMTPTTQVGINMETIENFKPDSCQPAFKENADTLV